MQQLNSNKEETQTFLKSQNHTYSISSTNLYFKHDKNHKSNFLIGTLKQINYSHLPYFIFKE